MGFQKLAPTGRHSLGHCPIPVSVDSIMLVSSYVWLYFIIGKTLHSVGFPGGSKNLPAMWQTWVQSLGWEDPLEKEIATHFSILPWKIPWTEEPGRLPSMGSQRVGHN